MNSGINKVASDLPVSMTLRRFIEIRLGGEPLQDDGDIFATGLANSLFALELIAFLEEKFQFEVDVADLELDNFRSITALTRLVQSKLGIAP